VYPREKNKFSNILLFLQPQFLLHRAIQLMSVHHSQTATTTIQPGQNINRAMALGFRIHTMNSKKIFALAFSVFLYSAPHTYLVIAMNVRVNNLVAKYECAKKVFVAYNVWTVNRREKNCAFKRKPFEPERKALAPVRSRSSTKRAVLVTISRMVVRRGTAYVMAGARIVMRLGTAPRASRIVGVGWWVLGRTAILARGRVV
jgi:hypothetical protein